MKFETIFLITFIIGFLLILLSSVPFLLIICYRRYRDENEIDKETFLNILFEVIFQVFMGLWRYTVLGVKLILCLVAFYFIYQLLVWLEIV